jgi:integrase
MPEIKVQRDDVLSPKEVWDMIDRASDPMHKCLIAMLYLYGMRISEALTLKKESLWIDKENKYLHCKVKVQKRTKRKDGKEKKVAIPYVHTVFVPANNDFALVIIEHWKTVKENHWVFQSPKYEDTHYLRQSAWKMLKKLNPDCWCHLFRHTRVTRLAEGGGEPYQIMAWGGWKDIRSVQNYIYRSPKLIKKLADEIS